MKFVILMLLVSGCEKTRDRAVSQESICDTRAWVLHQDKTLSVCWATRGVKSDTLMIDCKYIEACKNEKTDAATHN